MRTEEAAARRRFRAEYGAHRAAEGRAHPPAELLALPYLRTGPLAGQWAVRARSFEAFLHRSLRPLAADLGRPLELLDLGAGNGWLCHRAAREGHRAVALDVRDDAVDGLGAAAPFLDGRDGGFRRVAASFEALPFRARRFDLVVFNASLHYALDLRAALREAARVARRGGRLVVLDSPFYRRDAAGEAMVEEKRREAGRRFGERAQALLALPFVEFLTPRRLEDASSGLGLLWRRHRVLYPLGYEIRPLLARLRGRRPPSRFDLWQATIP
jgi:SAM-dependent methyltransferase